jgi:hypothetical protein
LHKINEKSRAGINGYFYIKNPLLWEWHFHKPLCEEMIFLHTKVFWQPQVAFEKLISESEFGVDKMSSR